HRNRNESGADLERLLRRRDLSCPGLDELRLLGHRSRSKRTHGDIVRGERPPELDNLLLARMRGEFSRSRRLVECKRVYDDGGFTAGTRGSGPLLALELRDGNGGESAAGLETLAGSCIVPHPAFDQSELFHAVF